MPHPTDLDLQHANRSKHEQLRDHFVQELLAGRLKPGQALPSERHMMETLGVARTTVRQAMAALENDGLIRRVQGKGTFIDTDARRKLERGQDIFALVVPETRGGFYPSLLHGFETTAAGISHQTIICTTNNNVDRQADIVLQLLDKEIGGVAIVPASLPPTPAHQVRQLQKHGIPLVFCHRRVEGTRAPLLALPFREMGRLAGKSLAEHGHRHVAFFSSHRAPSTDEYAAGLADSLQAAGSDVPPEIAYVGHLISLDEQAVQAALERVFAQEHRPTAVFATFDSLAEMIYLLLPRLGLRVPEDVSLVGVGGAWRDGAITRRLTSVVIDEIDVGRQAVTLLHEMRRGDRPLDDNTEIPLKPGLSEGKTVAAADLAAHDRS